MSATNKMVSLSKDQVIFLRGELVNILDSYAGVTTTDKLLAAELIKKLDGRPVKGAQTSGK
jgi:hypothetical protein